MTPLSGAFLRLAELGRTRLRRLLAQAKPCPNPECGHSNLEFKYSEDVVGVACIDCGFSGPKGANSDEALKLWDALVREGKDTTTIPHTVD